MALVTCEECGSSVSERAAACPKCGAPVAGAADHRVLGATLTTVQETSKRLKIYLLVSALLFWCGAVLFGMSLSTDGRWPLVGGVGLMMVLVGAGLYVSTRVRSRQTAARRQFLDAERRDVGLSGLFDA